MRTHGIGARIEGTDYNDVSDVCKVSKSVKTTTLHERDNNRLKAKGRNIKCDRSIISIVDNHVNDGQAQVIIRLCLHLVNLWEQIGILAFGRPE